MTEQPDELHPKKPVVPKPRILAFRLRTLLLFVAIAAIGITFYMNVQQSRLRAHDHYCKSLESAYKAVAHHIKDSVPERDKLDVHCGFDEWESLAATDRETLNLTADLWEDSMNHTLKKDFFWNVYNHPLSLLTSSVQVFKLPPMPEDDSKLEAWWDKHIKPYIIENNLHHGVNSSILVGNNIDIANAGQKTREQTARYYDLDDLLPNETMTTTGKNSR